MAVKTLERKGDEFLREGGGGGRERLKKMDGDGGESLSL